MPSCSFPKTCPQTSFVIFARSILHYPTESPPRHKGPKATQIPGLLRRAKGRALFNLSKQPGNRTGGHNTTRFDRRFKAGTQDSPTAKNRPTRANRPIALAAGQIYAETEPTALQQTLAGHAPRTVQILLRSPRNNVNRMDKLATGSDSFQPNIALDSGNGRKESRTPLKGLGNFLTHA